MFGSPEAVMLSPRGQVRRYGHLPYSSSAATASLSALPGDVLVKVLSFLSLHDIIVNVSRINYHFYKLSQRPELFETLDLSTHVNMDDELLLDLLCDLGWSSLRSLAPPPLLSQRGLNALSTCSSLERLALVRQPQLDPTGVQRVFEYCSWPITTLDLVRCTHGMC